MAEASPRPALQIQPERSLGWITLGSSIHYVVSKLKASSQLYPTLEFSYSPSRPILNPVIVNLPANGIRLRFDGPDQRLRLIEVLDFSLTTFVYKNTELVRRSKSGEEGAVEDSALSGPSFRHVYSRLFGPTYAGEYTPPEDGNSMGTYVLSYPGLAFSFPVKHRSWSEKVDFVSLLSSTATGSAISMAIFAGSSWPEARSSLYTEAATLPRFPALGTKSSDPVPDEVEEVTIYGAGKIELTRRSSPPVTIVLGETTPQDLVAELGPPDAIYRKNDRRISIHATRTSAKRRHPSFSPALDPQSFDTDQSSLQSYTEESDIEPDADEEKSIENQEECFYNYFHHGFDVLISAPAARSQPFPGNEHPDQPTSSSAPVVATKLILHGNIPGSFPFTRHRRSRWVIRTGDAHGTTITSEMAFAEISSVLQTVWKDLYEDEEEARQMQRGMVLNRGWDESPESSIELLGGFEESPTRGQAIESVTADALGGMNNTLLFGFPGLLFEVLKNDAVSALTVF